MVMATRVADLGGAYDGEKKKKKKRIVAHLSSSLSASLRLQWLPPTLTQFLQWFVSETTKSRFSILERTAEGHGNAVAYGVLDGRDGLDSFERLDFFLLGLRRRGRRLYQNWRYWPFPYWLTAASASSIRNALVIGEWQMQRYFDEYKL